MNMLYQATWDDGRTIDLPMGKAVCVGRNYVAHAQELNNPIPDEPLLFMKPSSSFQAFDSEVKLREDLGQHHYEAELVILIGSVVDRDTVNYADAVIGVGLGLDLTLRSVQTRLKSQGLPWERAKAYDGSCALTPFTPVSKHHNLHNSEYRFWINGELKQQGDTSLMINSVEALIANISQVFSLYPGDIVMTGTPAGVGALAHGDKLQLQYENGEKYYSTAIIT
ncbi:fumarylacetoacetate hydrolase family protein [Pseudoalteromonas citrea]